MTSSRNPIAHLETAFSSLSSLSLCMCMSIQTHLISSLFSCLRSKRSIIPSTATHTQTNNKQTREHCIVGIFRLLLAPARSYVRKRDGPPDTVITGDAMRCPVRISLCITSIKFCSPLFFFFVLYCIVQLYARCQNSVCESFFNV